MPSAQSELNKAVEKAADELTKKEEKSEETSESSEVVIDKEEEKETEEESSESESEEELSEAENKEALSLYKALRNPQSSSAIIAALAQQAGLLGRPEESQTKKEVREAKREIKEILAEGLGKEYSFLADRLGPAIEKVLEQERGLSESRFAEIQQANVEREVVTAYEKLAVETKGESKRLERRMAELSEEVPIGKMDVKTYMRRLYVLASSEKQTPSKKVADQIKKNANDVSSRLRGGAGQSNGIEMPKGKLNLNDSINFAIDQLSRENK